MCHVDMPYTCVIHMCHTYVTSTMGFHSMSALPTLRASSQLACLNAVNCPQSFSPSSATQRRCCNGSLGAKSLGACYGWCMEWLRLLPTCEAGQEPHLYAEGPHCSSICLEDCLVCMHAMPQIYPWVRHACMPGGKSLQRQCCATCMSDPHPLQVNGLQEGSALAYRRNPTFQAKQA